jgi:hypothetical protein
VALALAALVNGTQSNYAGGERRKMFMVDCKYKSNSTLPNINLTLGANKNTANLVLKSSDYVLKVSPCSSAYSTSFAPFSTRARASATWLFATSPATTSGAPPIIWDVNSAPRWTRPPKPLDLPGRLPEATLLKND